MKVCNKCKQEKPIERFYFRKDIQLYNSVCKDCTNARMREYNANHKEKLKEYHKKYYISHREELIKKNLLYRENNIEKDIERRKKYYQENKEKIDKRKKEYYLKNKDKFREYDNNYKANKRKNDPIFKLKTTIRRLIIKAFKDKNVYKNQHAKEIIGCEFEKLHDYLLQTYKNNYGYEWDGIEPVHIDHIKPLKYAKTKEEVIKLNHYTNLQLLKRIDNLKKGSKINYKIKKGDF